MPFCDSNFDFQILIRTEAGKERAYCGYQESDTTVPSQTRNFIAVHYDGTNDDVKNFAGAWDSPGSHGNQSTGAEQFKFSTGELYHKISNMVSCSFQDWQWGQDSDGNISNSGPTKIGSEVFLDEPALTASLEGDNFYDDGGDMAARQTSTGSITFRQVSNQVDPVKEIKFWGQKVCDVLGLPEAVWISMDAVHVDASANKHSFRGDIVGSNMVVHNRFSIPQGADIGGGLPFKIHYNTADKLIRFMDNTGINHTNNIIIGYARDVEHNYSAYPGSGEGYEKRRFRISTDGAIGAGTLTPSYPLHVSASWYTEEIAAVFEQGNVGIGTLTPSTELEVIGDIKLSGTVESTDNAVGFKMLNQADFRIKNNSGTYKGVLEVGSDDILRFSNDDLTSTWIKTDTRVEGKLSIKNGSTAFTPNAALDVSSSTGHFLADWSTSNGTSGTMIAPSPAVTAGWARGYHFGTLDGDGTVTSYGGFGGYGSGQSTFYRFYIGSAYNNNGISVTTNNTVGVGTATPSGQIHIVTSGLTDGAWITSGSFGTPSDNGLRIRPGLGVGYQYGLADQHSQAVAFVNEQGTTNQAIILGDVDPTNSSTLFGVSVAASNGNPSSGDEGNWSSGIRLNLTGQGDLTIAGDIISGEYISTNNNWDDAYKNFGNLDLFSVNDGDITTAQFTEYLSDIGMISSNGLHPTGSTSGENKPLQLHAVGKVQWSYAGSADITDGPHGELIELAGCWIEVMNNSTSYHIRITTPNTTNGGTQGRQVYMYNKQGAHGYSSGWYKMLTSKGDQTIDGDLSVEHDLNVGGVFTATSHIKSNGQYYYGDSKEMFDFGDSWLRINQNGDFTSGTYSQNHFYIGSTLTVNGNCILGDDISDSHNVKGKLKAHYLGITNADSTTGAGLSLYNGAVSVVGTLPQYGMAFAGTATFGTHGGCTDNWSTFLTTSDTTGRGWIFKARTTPDDTSGNVASIDNEGDFACRDIDASGVISGDGSGLTNIPGTGGSSTADSANSTHNLYMRRTSPTVYFRDTDNRSAMIHNNSNLLYFLRGDGNDTTTWTQYDSVWGMIHYLENNNTVFGGQVTAKYDVIAYSSDRRLKENIINIDGALDKISRINGVFFNWDHDKCVEAEFANHPKGTEAGVIAQEIQEVLPSAVELAPFDTYVPDPDSDEGAPEENISKSGKDYLTVKYEKIVPLLIEGIKEQQEQIDELKNEIKKLKEDK